jgi:hypothetical protein
MDTPKEQIIRLFLDFLSRHRPLADARVATLGGQGIEAKIWTESGIPPEHGWLIELNRTRGNRLIENHRYRHHNRLGTFHQILAGQGGPAARIDGFHLDLCGTVTERVIHDFSPLLPLILQSTGRCLGITVSDQRRNRALEEWPVVMKKAERLFGKHTAGLLEKIETLQTQLPIREGLPSFMSGFDPCKGARREFSLMVELIDLFQEHSWVPVEIVRYVYVSRYGGKPFRMRSFFFHFAPVSTPSSDLAVARTWTKSPLYFCSDQETFTEIKACPKRVERRRPGDLMSASISRKYFLSFSFSGR